MTDRVPSYVAAKRSSRTSAVSFTSQHSSRPAAGELNIAALMHEKSTTAQQSGRSRSMGQSLHRGQLSSLGQSLHRSQLCPPGHERPLTTAEPGKTRSLGPGVPRGQVVSPVHEGDMTTQEAGKSQSMGHMWVFLPVAALSSPPKPNSGLPPACTWVVLKPGREATAPAIRLLSTLA